jgi:hypothetical protein
MTAAAAALGLTVTLALASTSYSAYALSKSQLKAKTLSLSDMPSGWSVDNSASSNPDNLTGCFARLQAFNHPVKGIVRAKVNYANGNAPLLQETLISGKGAIKQYAKYVAVMNSCKTVSITTSGATATGSVGALSLPTLGDGSKAYAIKLSIKGINVGYDLVLFRVGQIPGDIVYADIGTPDISEVQSFATAAVNKIEGMPTTPPTTP